MQRLLDKHIVLGVGGSIACYRACDLVRDLRAQGASVRVAPTRAAQAFVTPLAFEALSAQPCLLTSLDLDHGRIPHVEEAYKAAAVVVAPASADLIAKMANGFADEAILSLLLSFVGPVVVAPAMETHMWRHPATQANIETLKRRGVVVVGPESGALASGRSGEGRLAALPGIVEAVLQATTPPTLRGRRILVTAGPTVEDIDPVRSLTNRSSGKMGVAIARAFALRGADVELVHGPLRGEVPSTPGLRAHAVRSAAEMAAQTFALVDDRRSIDACVMTAAVADFTPTRAAHKLKKTDGAPVLTLAPTTDILATLGDRAERAFVLVGFAAETQDVERYADDKRVRKHCDLVVANDVGAAGSGFDVDTNRLYFARDPQRGPSSWLAQRTKEEAAEAVVDDVIALLPSTSTF
ncbi:MAG TPA: bifunctional phosphopantothenoylcysteine decarboxylase/phosphopantothenate--cysteine ligase CoaBC [Myxococcota bacterium]